MSLVSMKTAIALLGALLVIGILSLRYHNRRRHLKQHAQNANLQPSAHPDNTKEVPWRGEIIALHIMAIDTPITGDKILKVAKKYNLDYGPYNIFHRHQKIDQQSDIIFSLASAVEPGIFELETFDAYETAGLTLFIRLGDLKDPKTAFETMLQTAQAITDFLHAELQDPSHHPLTDATIQAYRTQIAV